MNTFEESRKQREKMMIEGFVNREGVLVRPVKGGLAPVGKAYAFFDCDAPIDEVTLFRDTIYLNLV